MTSTFFIVTFKCPLTPAGQSYGRGGRAGVIGGVCQHPGLRRVSGWQPGCSTATYGVCSDGKSVSVREIQGSCRDRVLGTAHSAENIRLRLIHYRSVLTFACNGQL